MDVSKLKLAPITAAERKQLAANLADLRGTAERNRTTLDDWEERNEREAGRQHFELGCWLYYYNRRVGTEGVEARIDCARRIFLEGITNPRYQFFTAFSFGERQFDTIFEMGDAKEVIEGLRQLIPTDKTGNIAKAFEYFGWPSGLLV